MRKKIVIVGLGLIGGSIAKALALNTDHLLLGLDRDEDVLLDAQSCGAIAGKAGPEDLRDADIVWLCLYPEDALAFAREYGPVLRENCILTDACGIKGEICAGMEALAGTGKYVFVAGHPMAGKEKNGFVASDAGLFVGASYLLVQGKAPDWAAEEIAGLARVMGFGRIVRTTAAQHDRVIAFTSQLPHVLACAYVMSPRCAEHKGFSAGSYRDVSRVADINAALWTRLFLDNRAPLTAELDTLIENLGLFRALIAQGRENELYVLLDEAGQIKRREG